MIRSFLCVVLIAFALPSFAQDEIDESKMVGFACFYEGRETKLVSRFRKMLNRKQYTSIARELRSDLPGARVMAVFCLERLDAVNKRKITEEEQVLIEQVKTSDELVPVCSGCVPDPGIPIKKVFNSEILWRAGPWLERRVRE